MLVGELCVRDVIIAERQASVLEVAQLMREYHVGDIVIVERDEQSRKPTGIVTDRDIVLELIAKEQALESVTAADLTGPELVTVEEHVDLWDALQTMRGKGVRRLPVVDKHGGLIGILSADDVLEILADQMQDLVILVGKGQRREQQTRR